MAAGGPRHLDADIANLRHHQSTRKGNTETIEASRMASDDTGGECGRADESTASRDGRPTGATRGLGIINSS